MYLIDTSVSVPGSSSRGGTEKQLYLLTSSLDPDKFRPIIIQLCPDNSVPVRVGKIEGVNLIHFPTSKLYNFNGFRHIKYLLTLSKENQIDIIHTFFEKSEILGWLIKKLARVPVWVTSRRDLGFKRKKIYNKIFQFTSWDCTKCIANCFAVKDQILHEENIPSERVEVIYNGIDISGYQPISQPKTLREELRIGRETPLVGLIANFNFEIKGHLYFLGAAKKILESLTNVKFILVGDGPLRSRYEEVAQELNIGKDLFFLGERSDIPFILHSLDVSVLSSTSEGFSNVILESMATGKPVVATNVGGSKEMIQDGVTGYLVPPANSIAMADAIISLLKNPEKAVAMGEMGRKVVQERFTLEAMVKKHEDLYISLLKNRSRE